MVPQPGLCDRFRGNRERAFLGDPGEMLHARNEMVAEGCERDVTTSV